MRNSQLLSRSVGRACVGALAGTGVFRREVSASRAGLRWNAPGWCVPGRWRAGLRPSLEDLDDGHSAAAARTRRKQIQWVWHFDRLWRGRDAEQFAGTRKTGLA